MLRRCMPLCGPLGSQDAWVYRTPLLRAIYADVVLGLPGCDNRSRRSALPCTAGCTAGCMLYIEGSMNRWLLARFPFAGYCTGL